MISDRLNRIIEMLDPVSTLVDIGCDHALASIEAIKKNKAKYVIASDINAGPLEVAKKNIKDEFMSDKIKLVLSDGFKNINDSYQEVIISGMGGYLIKDILSLAKPATFVVSPNNNQEVLREYIIENGYEIIDEDFIKDKGIYYQIIKFKPGISDKYQDIELEFGKINLKNKNPYLLEFLNKRLEVLEESLKHIKDNKEELIQKIEYIKRAINY